MEISDKEKKQKQHTKELESLRNKMGKNIIWFNSLPKKLQYNILYDWKKEKYKNKLKAPKISYAKPYFFGFAIKNPKKVKIINYPPSFKHFIKKYITIYKMPINLIREEAINAILENKKK